MSRGWQTIDWLLDRIEYALGVILDHGIMIICSLILGFIFAWGLMSGLG